MNKKALTSFVIIENLAYWEGGLNATILGEYLGIAPANARKYINDYQRRYEGNLVYNGAHPEKLYEPQTNFVCHVISGNWPDYIQFLSTYKASALNSSALDLGPYPLQTVEPSVFRHINFAIRTRKALTVMYHSKSRPDGRIRIIHPHALASSGLRWHCRAFDSDTSEFRDFNLSRIGRIIRNETSSVDPAMDSKWVSYVTLQLGPNTQLSPLFQEVVKRDYGFTTDLCVRVREAMVPYFMQFHNISTSVDADNPDEKPLMLINLNDVRHCLLRYDFN